MLMQASGIKLYEVLKEQFSPKKAKAIVASLDETITEKIEGKSNVLSTKEDIGDLKIEIQRVKAEMIKWTFIFWMGNVVTTIGTVITIFSLLNK